MIGFLRGTLLAADPPHVLVEVAGVGYELEVPPTVLARLPPPGGMLELHTVLELRTDGLVLYGFGDLRERHLFRLLRRASGIGPRLALATLATLTPEEIEEALGRRDPRPFVRVPGIGKKTAERLVLELSGRVSSPREAMEDSRAPRADALAALVHLGFRRAEAERLLVGTDPHETDVAALVRAALRHAQEGKTP